MERGRQVHGRGYRVAVNHVVFFEERDDHTFLRESVGVLVFVLNVHAEEAFNRPKGLAFKMLEDGFTKCLCEVCIIFVVVNEDVVDPRD